MQSSKVVVTGYPNFRKPQITNVVELSWEAFAKSLCNVREQPCTPPSAGLPSACVGKDCPHKKGPAWSPVRLKADGQHRLNVNVEAITVAVFDLDDVTNLELVAVANRLKELGLEYVIHSTHRHLHEGPNHNCVRLVLPMSREAAPDEWPTVWAGALVHLRLPHTPGASATEITPKVLARGVDTQCKDLSRLFFMPSRPKGAEPLTQRGTGEALDVDLVKTLAPPPPVYVPPAQDLFALIGTDDEEEDEDDEPSSDQTPAPTAASEAAAAEPESELKVLRRALLERRRVWGASPRPEDREKYRVINAVLTKTRLAEAHDADAGRSASVNRAASIMAFAFPAGTSWEAAVEVLRPAVVAMDCEPEGVEHYLDIGRVSYERATGRAIEHARDRARKEHDKSTIRAAVQELSDEAEAARPRASRTSAQPQNQAGDEGGEEDESPGPTSRAREAIDRIMDDAFAAPFAISPTKPKAPEPKDWVSEAVTTANDKILPCGASVYAFLRYSRETADTIRYNKLANRIEVRGGMFDGAKQEVFDIEVVDYLQKKYYMKVAKTDVRDRILRVAYDNAYDPIADYLDGVVWDGVPRLDRFFLGESYVAQNSAGEDVTVPAYVTARRVNKAGEDITGYLLLVGAKTFISAVARGLAPGPKCQVDTMLVLEGRKEGEGKSSLIRILAGPWYIETRLNLDNKDSQMIPAGHWLVELGELSSVRKSEGDALKSFLTTIQDKFRRPYGREVEEFWRRCIFIGTTNDEGWLSYDKGVRRYWPVYVEAVNLAAVERDRDQLWAEAVVRFRAGEKWHLADAADKTLAAAQAEQRVESSLLEQMLVRWWTGLSEDQRKKLTFISKIDLAQNVLKVPEDQIARMRGTILESSMSKAMERMGFTQSDLGRGALSGWVPPGFKILRDDQGKVVQAKREMPGFMRLVHNADATKDATKDGAS